MATDAVLPTRRLPHLRNSVGTLAVFAIIAVVEAAIPRFRSLLYQLPYFATPWLVTAFFNFLRDTRPDRVPSRLAPDSAEMLKLRRTKKLLYWATGAAFVLTVAIAIGIVAACTCDVQPIRALMVVAPVSFLFIVSLGFDTYIKERTELPATRTGPYASWPGRRRPISEFKPFVSDHWGQPVSQSAQD